MRGSLAVLYTLLACVYLPVAWVGYWAYGDTLVANGASVSPCLVSSYSYGACLYCNTGSASSPTGQSCMRMYHTVLWQGARSSAQLQPDVHCDAYASLTARLAAAVPAQPDDADPCSCFCGGGHAHWRYAVAVLCTSSSR